MFSTAIQGASTRAILGIVLACVINATAQASLFLPPATFTYLSGTNVMLEPDLAGVVLYDALIPFTIKDSSGTVLYEATLQNRVVQSTSTNLLHFYYRIRDVNTLHHGSVVLVKTTGFPALSCWVEFRVDGLGVFGPTSALRSPAPGGSIRFEFASPGLGPYESHSFFIKTGTTFYAAGGVTTIYLATGEFATVSTVRPL